MKEFSRRGHYRTNANGTTFWVRDHEVHQEEYLLEYRNNKPFINGQRVIPNYKCPKCGREVFFYQNEHGSKVFFDELGWPWPKHGCFIETNRTVLTGTGQLHGTVKRHGPNREMKAALERRGHELTEKMREREARRAVIKTEYEALMVRQSELLEQKAELKTQRPNVKKKKRRKKAKEDPTERSYQRVCRELASIERRIKLLEFEMIE